MMTMMTIIFYYIPLILEILNFKVFNVVSNAYMAKIGMKLEYEEEMSVEKILLHYWKVD